MDRKEIAKALEEVASLLELHGENQFKVRAYTNAARIISGLDTSVEELIKLAEDGGVKGLGPATTEAVTTLFETGSLPYLEELREEFPEGFLELLNIPGLGAKKLRVLRSELEIENVDDLERACQEDLLAELRGFGEKTQKKILEGIERLRSYRGLFLYQEAYEWAEIVVTSLKKSKQCIRIELAGSLRRNKELVKDVDIVASADKPAKLMETFTQLEQVKDIIAHGETKSSVILQNDLPIDLRVVADEQFASTLMHFTGSKEHNTKLRSIAKKRNLKLNEYGLFDGDSSLKADSEEELHNHLGLAYLVPELREDYGEVERAEEAFANDSDLKDLVKAKDIKGIIHAHSTYSDGANTLREMAHAAIEFGYEYLGISDHSQSAAYARGLKPDRIRKQHEEIDELNEELAPFKIFKGIESDILPNGKLDYEDNVLESFDFIIASVHSKFDMDEKKMTKRIISALENPNTTILGHATGRILLRRDGYPINIPAVLEAAAKHDVAVELNANPKRLDLDWRFHQRAQELGVLVPICPDAHSIEALQYVHYGVGCARKGGLSKNDIPTCWSRKKVEKFFSKRK